MYEGYIEARSVFSGLAVAPFMLKLEAHVSY